MARFFHVSLAGAVLLAAALAGGAALAGDAESKPAAEAVPPSVTFDPKQFVVPQLGESIGNFTAGTSGEQKSGIAIPNKIDLGPSQLRFDAGRKDPIPRVGIDAADPTVLNPNLPQQKDSPLTPYVGFTLSTPTQ